MAALFKLVAGSSSLDLNDGDPETITTNYWLEHYTPMPGPDGDTRVTETAIIFVMGTSAADMRSNMDALSAFIERVALWSRHGDTVDRVYLHFAPDGVSAANARRAQVYKVDQIYEDDWIDVPWRNEYKLRVELSITHDNMGEGVTEITVPLTNTNGTDITDGSLRVYNSNDGSGSPPNKRCGYVHIDGADILGDLPAGCRIQIAGSMTRVYLGMGALVDLTNSLQIEGEGFDGETGDTDANCSGGKYLTLSAGYEETDWVSFAVYGAWYLPVLRYYCGTTGAGITVQSGYMGQPKTLYPTYTTNTYGFIPLVPVKLPPARYRGASQAQYMSFKSSINARLDYVQYLPLDCGWRIVDLVQAEPAPNIMVDDTVLGETFYAYGSLALETAFDGPGIYLQPGKDQRLWVLVQQGVPGSTDGALITANYAVSITYRPRYRSL